MKANSNLDGCGCLVKLWRGRKGSDNVPNANWNRDDRQANLNRNDPSNSNSNIGCRSSVEVHFLFQLRDLIQPPSIRPISFKLDCAWKIFVSFPNLSSKQALNLRMINSRYPDALYK